MPAELSPPITAPRPDAAGEEQIDPELLALPNPPRRERTWTLVLLFLTALASAAMAVALRRDAFYAFASPTPADLGDLREATALVDNAFVRGHAMLGAASAIRYERPFDSDSYRLSPVAGRRDLWVEVHVPEGQETARYVPPSSFSGRLVHLDGAGLRHRGLAGAIARATGEAVPQGAWLLVDGEPPSNARWAVALLVLFCGFAAWNLGVIARLMRRVR